MRAPIASGMGSEGYRRREARHECSAAGAGMSFRSGAPLASGCRSRCVALESLRRKLSDLAKGRPQCAVQFPFRKSSFFWPLSRHRRLCSTPRAAPAAGRAGGAAPNLTAAEPMGPVENLTAYPVPPEGFNVSRENIPHGEVKLVEYQSKTLGIRRPLRVYTPPAIRPPAGIQCSICSTGWAIPAPNGCNGRGRRSSPTT